MVKASACNGEQVCYDVYELAYMFRVLSERCLTYTDIKCLSMLSLVNYQVCIIATILMTNNKIEINTCTCLNDAHNHHVHCSVCLKMGPVLVN